MKKFKPIRVFCEENLDPQQIILGISAIRQLLEIAGATDLVGVELHDLVDLNHYHVEHDGHRFLHGGAIQGYMYLEDYKSKHECINFLLTQNLILINHGKETEIPLQGFSIEGAFGVAAVGVENSPLNNVIAIVAILHEFGHIYGLPREDRDDIVKNESLGDHCLNVCIMSTDQKVLQEVDLFEKPFCDQCLADLQKFFKE